MASVDPVAFQVWMSLQYPQPQLVICQVYSDGALQWSGAEPTEQERREAEQIIAERHGKTGYVITLER